MCFSSFQGKEEGIIVTLDEEDRLSFAARPPNLDRDLNVFSPNELRVGLVTGIASKFVQPTDIHVTSIIPFRGVSERLLQFKGASVRF
jgi:hypothetical protein